MCDVIVLPLLRWHRTNTISGVVTVDKTGETVMRAFSVRVKGQESKGNITDINGKYQELLRCNLILQRFF